MSSVEQWCEDNGFGDAASGLKGYIGALEDLKFTDDGDINDLIKDLGLKLKQKLAFKKAVAKLKEAGNDESKTNNDGGNDVQPGAMVFAANNGNNDEKDNDEGFTLKPDMPIESGVYIIPTIKKENISGNWKTIMVIGETGSGKSTTLNSMINYLWNVSLDDHYRFVLIPPPSDKAAQGKSVTSDVTSYHFEPPKLDYGLTVVDTPGFGDTSGHDTDVEIVKKIEKAFKEDLDTMDAVFFVLKASQSRLTAMQRYVFNAMLRVFGKDIADNLFLLITFCDGADPPVYASVKAYELPHKESFELNNSAFFTGFDSYFENRQVTELDLQKNRLKMLSKDEFSKWQKPECKPMRKVTAQFWDMGMDAMANLFDKLGETTAKSLKLSRDVLDLRNNLQLRIKHLHNKITRGLNKLSFLRQIIDTVKVHAKEVNGAKDFEIIVPDVELQKFSTSNNVTQCCNCKYSCHESCAFDNSAEKRHCAAMRNDYCTVCPKRCYWDCHINTHTIMKYVNIQKKVTKEELKKKFDDSTKGMTNSERIIITETRKIIELQGKISEDIEEVRHCINELGRIALKPCVMEEDDYYELMIQSEEEQKEPNWKDRVAAINVLREQAKQIRIIQLGHGNETKQLFEKQLQQLEKDLQDIKKIQGEAPSNASSILDRISNSIKSTQTQFIYGKPKNNNMNNKNNNQQKGGIMSSIGNLLGM